MNIVNWNATKLNLITSDVGIWNAMRGSESGVRGDDELTNDGKHSAESAESEVKEK